MAGTIAPRPKWVFDGALTAAIMALLAGAWLLVSRGGSGSAGGLLDQIFHLLVYCYVILALPPLIGGSRKMQAIALVGAVLLAGFLTADLTAMRFFGSPFPVVYPYLPVSAESASLASLAAYASSYISLGVLALAFGAVFAAMVAASRIRQRSGTRMAVLVALPLLFAATLMPATTFASVDGTAAALLEEPPLPSSVLDMSGGSDAIELADDPGDLPRTILVVIMESTGAGLTASSRDMLLSEAIIEDGGTDGWVNFSNAVTTSNATDISVPSLLSGGGAHEPAEKVERLPLLWSLARARGYRTSFITSSTMHWAHFEHIVSGAQVDEVWTASESGLPFVNDLAVDDHYAYSKAAEILRQTGKPVFITLYPQALHWPFQTESRFDIDPALATRRDRATAIAEAGFGHLFEALRETGRLEDALIVVVGDHGEFNYEATLRIPKMRLDTFKEGILSPIFLVKAPSSLDPARADALAGNAAKLVASHDIAPSLADLLGTRLSGGLEYDGHSLFAPIPDERIAYSISTNDWRHWLTSTLAISQGDERMICDQNALCGLYSASGHELEFERASAEDDALFQLALRQPAMRASLGQIYRGHYR